MLNETFLFKGKRANSMGIELQDSIIITPAAPRFTEYVIPGRNGTLYEPDGTYEDRTIIASCFLLSHLLERDIDTINSWLISDPGYHRFEDTQDPNHFMMARAKSGIEKHERGGILNAFPLEFVAKPQRFLKTGEKQISVDTVHGATIKNPTKYSAFPLIEVEGSCSYYEIAIGKNRIAFSNLNNEKIVYDAEMDAAYIGDQTADHKIEVTNNIILPPGETNVIISLTAIGGIASVKITPRWWEI